MTTPESDADLAFTYAWWLTGDVDAAEAAVRQAAELLPANGEVADRRVALLEAVRAGAVQERTMCPASELAVLHDTQGIELSEAARLVRIDPADARVELAHGRLEALVETVREPFAHPERLGGLAVGNPPDVAHARQCVSCGKAEALLQRGREALRELPPPETPSALLALLGPAVVPEPDVEPEVAPEPAAEPEPQAEPEVAAEPTNDEAAFSDEAHKPKVIQFVDGALEEPLGEVLEDREPERDRHRWLLPAVVVLAAILLLVTVVANMLSGRAVTSGESEPATPVGAELADAEEPPPQTAPPPEGFRIESAGLLRRGEFVPAGPGIVFTPTDRVRITVRYSGARDGVVLEGRWTVDGEPFRTLRVALGGLRSTHVFTAPVPDDGWPQGLHQVVLGVGGEVVASVDFRVL